MRKERRLVKTCKAIEDSLIHWRDNLSRLKMARELGYEMKSAYNYCWYVAHATGVRRNIARFDDISCALCNLFADNDCEECPLQKEGYGCNNSFSPWRDCRNAEGNEIIIYEAKRMVGILEDLLKKYRRKTYKIKRRNENGKKSKR